MQALVVTDNAVAQRVEARDQRQNDEQDVQSFLQIEVERCKQQRTRENLVAALAVLRSIQTYDFGFVIADFRITGRIIFRWGVAGVGIGGGAWPSTSSGHAKQAALAR